MKNMEKNEKYSLSLKCASYLAIQCAETEADVEIEVKNPFDGEKKLEGKFKIIVKKI